MFKQKKRIRHHSEHITLTQRISKRIFVVQRRLADWMQRRTRNWGKRHQTLFLFFLCIVLGGLSVYRGLEVFDAKEHPGNLKSVEQRPLPVLITPQPHDPVPVINDTDVFRRFRNNIDSLKKTPQGRAMYQQFLKERPGFMDSLAYIEKLTKQSFPHH